MKGPRLFAIPLMLIAACVFWWSDDARAGAARTEIARVLHAAKAGNVRAQVRLGRMYQTGRGVPQSYVMAAKWFHRAAEHGDSRAQLALGLLHNGGQGVKRDLVRAYLWINLSAAAAVGEDREFRVRLRDSIASKMTINQLALAQQMAVDWYFQPEP